MILFYNDNTNHTSHHDCSKQNQFLTFLLLLPLLLDDFAQVNNSIASLASVMMKNKESNEGKYRYSHYSKYIEKYSYFFNFHIVHEKLKYYLTYNVSKSFDLKLYIQ